MKPKLLLCLALVLSELFTAFSARAVNTGDWRAMRDWDYDGKRILGHVGNDVCLWDATDGHLIKRFAGHGERIVFAQFGPDGKYALSSSGWVPEAAQVPDSSMHIVSKDTSTRLWNLDTGKQLYCLTHRIATDMDSTGKLMITYSEAETGSNRVEAAIWETLTERLASKFLLDSYSSPASGLLELSPDGRSCLFFNGGTAVVLRDVSDGREIIRIRTRISCFRFVAPNAFLNFGPDEATLWDLKTGQISRRVKDPFKGTTPITSASDGRKLVGVVPKFFTIEMESGRFKQGSILESGTSPVVGIPSPDGKTFVIEWLNKDGCSGTAELFDINSCQKIATIDLGGWGHLVAFSPDGATLLTGGSSFRVYASKDGRLLHEFKLLGNEVRSYMWSSRG